MTLFFNALSLQILSPYFINIIILIISCEIRYQCTVGDFLVAHRWKTNTIAITNEKHSFVFLLFFFFFFSPLFLHPCFHEVLFIISLASWALLWLELPLELCNEVSEQAIIPRGSQCSQIPSLPSPSTMKT